MGEKDNKQQTVCVSINGERKPLEVVELDEVLPDITEENCEEMAAELFKDTSLEMEFKIPWIVAVKMKMMFLGETLKLMVKEFKRALIGK